MALLGAGRIRAAVAHHGLVLKANPLTCLYSVLTEQQVVWEFVAYVR